MPKFDILYPWDGVGSLTVNYTFTKGSPPVHYYKDGSGFDGDPDEVNIQSVIDPVTNFDWLPALNDCQFDFIETRCFEHAESYYTEEDFQIAPED